MAALKRSQRVIEGLGMMGNFIEKPLRVGDIVLNDDGQHLIWANIEDVVDGFSLEGKSVEANSADLKFNTESSVSIKIGGSANATVAEGEVQIKFEKRKSAFISLKQVHTTSLKLALIDSELTHYWKQKGFDKAGNRNKYHFIAQILEAESGTMIFSEERGNTVVITGKNNTPISSISAIGDGSVEYVSNSKSTLEIISATKIQPLYVAVRYKANGKFEIVG